MTSAYKRRPMDKRFANEDRLANDSASPVINLPHVQIRIVSLGAPLWKP